MTKWSLQTLLSGLHDDIEMRLKMSRATMGHPVSKGDASEKVWLDMLSNYLPERYRAAKAHVVDSEGNFSDQIDVVVFDRQYTPFIFKFEGQTIIPAEGVYAVFETKQELTAQHVDYAQKKIASVRNLHRTSLPIPYAKGTYPPKPLIPILGGILTFESSWSPPMGAPLVSALSSASSGEELDIGCVAASGEFRRNAAGDYTVNEGGKPATAFLFNLIATLQFSGTVPMIDVGAYSAWLAK